jgi:hypothetical protein
MKPMAAPHPSHTCPLPKFNRAVMRKTTIVESKSDELPNCFRVHTTYSIHRSCLLVETGELLMRISGLLVVLFPGSS